jgi:H+-transporting ATPase
MTEEKYTDEEEGGDVLNPVFPIISNYEDGTKNQKVTSDITSLAMVGAEYGLQRRPRRYRSVSDAALMILQHPPGQLRASDYLPRRREISSVDQLVKYGYLPGLDDLSFAEQVQEYGTRRERIASGISDIMLEQNLKKEEVFELNEKGLTSEEAAKRLKKYGPNELPEKIDPKWLVFLRQFWAPMPIMIWIAIIIELAIENFLDMGILLAIQLTNASISFYELNKAGNAIAALKSSLKPTATVKRDGKWKVINATEVVPGDTVLLASGSAIPADCRVNSGEIDVDQAALTGESLPVTFYKLDSAKMGSTVVRGEVEGTVEFTGGNTFFGKTASLLQTKPESSHLQKILMTIMYVLVGLSLVLCLTYFIYLLAKKVPPKEAISFTVVLLVASIPLAIEIVTTTTLAIGSKKLVKHGAIVAKLSAIEDLAGMSILCSDKTGTLTLNKMVLQEEDTPIYCEGETLESVLVFAAQAAKWKEPPRDALDRLTLGSVNMSLLEPFEQLDFLPFDPTTKRTEGTVKDSRTGEIYKTSKGAPHIILALLDPNDEVREHVEKDVARLGELGIRSLAVARTYPDSDDWKMIGLLTFLDPPRPDTKKTIEDADHYGVQVKMITGDHLLIARNTAKQLGMGNYIFGPDSLPLLDEETKQAPPNLCQDYGDLCLVADGFAQVYPEHKYLVVECLRGLRYTVGMTGDGVNDAPALKRADVGIAVAGATDAARAAADIVLTEEGLGTIIHGIVIAREIFQRIASFITYRIAATLQLLFFFFIAIFTFHPKEYQEVESILEEGAWPEFFHMPVLMLMLITLLNDGTLITIAYDYARPNDTPDKWHLPALYLASSILGAVSCGSSLLLLYFLLDSWNSNSFFQSVGMQSVEYGQIITAIYLKVSVSDFLTLFSSRTGQKFFWQVTPGPLLVIGGFIALFISSILSIFWPMSTLDGIPVDGLRKDMGLFGFVWIYCLFFWFIQDFIKVLTFRWMYRTNFNNISTSGVVVLPDSALKIMKDLDEALDPVLKPSVKD